MEQQTIASAKNRTGWITFICIIGFIGFAIMVAGFLIPESRDLMVQEFGFSSVIISMLIALIGLIGLIGSWRMRRWGVYFYLAMAVISIVYGLIVGISGYLSYIIPILVLIVLFVNFKKMN